MVGAREAPMFSAKSIVRLAPCRARVRALGSGMNLNTMLLNTGSSPQKSAFFVTTISLPASQ